jgi:hypothetical protein
LYRHKFALPTVRVPVLVFELPPASVIASRVLGQEMFEVQLRGALALTLGIIIEMQTGEGKTLAAVPAVACYARENPGVHVITANDYLARRDACRMGEIYRRLGLSVGCVQQSMTPDERSAAYACDITYATASLQRLVEGVKIWTSGFSCRNTKYRLKASGTCPDLSSDGSGGHGSRSFRVETRFLGLIGRSALTPRATSPNSP